ncbi:MAG: hypothetical protein R3F30_15230 [Planctomycetota bacterium]
MARNREIEEPIEIVEDESASKLNFDVGIAIATTVVLLGAIVFVMIALRDHYGAGPLA